MSIDLAEVLNDLFASSADGHMGLAVVHPAAAVSALDALDPDNAVNVVVADALGSFVLQ